MCLARWNLRRTPLVPRRQEVRGEFSTQNSFLETFARLSDNAKDDSTATVCRRGALCGSVSDAELLTMTSVRRQPLGRSYDRAINS